MLTKEEEFLTKGEEKERCEGQRKAALPGAPKKTRDTVKMTLKALPTPQPPAPPQPISPDQGLVVQVPDGDVAVAAAREAHLGIGADGQRVAGGRRRRQLGLDARRGRRQVPDGQSAGLAPHDQRAPVRQQLARADVVIPVLGGKGQGRGAGRGGRG